MAHYADDFFGSNVALGANFKAALDRVTEAVLNNSKLHLVADFDHTLTTFCSKQCHDIIAMHDEYPKEFHTEYENVCKMSFAANEFHLWWRIAHDLIVNRSGLTEEMFQRSLKSAGIKLRAGAFSHFPQICCNPREVEVYDANPYFHSGTADLLSYCRDMKIPVVVTSAGIANVITSVLEAHGISSVHDEHFHIDANHMEFHSDDGTLLRILPEIPIHSSAKKFVHERAPHMFSTISHDSSDESSKFILDEFLDMKTLLMRDNVIAVATDVNDDRKLPDDDVIQKEDECTSLKAGYLSQPSSANHVGTAAVILGDKPGDFEVLSHLSDLNEAFLFRIGFALNNQKAEELLNLKCCDVILIGETHSTDVVLKLMKSLNNTTERLK